LPDYQDGSELMQARVDPVIPAPAEAGTIRDLSGVEACKKLRFLDYEDRSVARNFTTPNHDRRQGTVSFATR
jgi:hypothetical protein